MGRSTSSSCFHKVNFSLIVGFRVIREGAKLELRADSTQGIAEGEHNATGRRYAYLEWKIRSDLPAVLFTLAICIHVAV